MNNETTTDYILRTEQAAAALKTAGEEVSDALLIAMKIKGLPHTFSTFSALTSQKTDEPGVTEFKVALRCYEDTMKARGGTTADDDQVLYTARANANSPNRSMMCFCVRYDTIVDVTLYRELIGSLIYAMTCTRPYICWIVSKLSQYLSKPTAEHHACAKQVLRYIKGTLNYEFVFCKSDQPLKVSGYSDSDWVGSLSDRKSVSGYCFTLNSGPVSWKS